MFLTDQEEFWKGEFGDKYISRNHSQKLLASSLARYSNILSNSSNVYSVMELGANIGINLKAMKELLTESELSAIEINSKAVTELKKIGLKEVYHMSVFDFQVDYQRDFVFTRGVLIHLNPDKLHEAYKTLYDSSRKYICIAEYYNPSPVIVSYHGQEDRLFKRDFAGELMDKYPDLKLIKYGFVYHNDKNFPQDDITWFLLEK